MAKGSWTGTASSAELLAADDSRSCVVIQKTNTTVIALGFGEAAVAGQGVQLFKQGDTIILRGTEAWGAINVIGNGGTGTYQTFVGSMDYVPGPHIT